jgi:Protein of unknown function (DUF3455)
MKNINLAVVGSLGFTAIFSISVFAMTTAPATPENLKPPQSEKVAFALSAKGVQIYQCSVNKNDATKFEWVFKAPEAELFDQAKAKVGKHYGGPTWESNDGSKVQGEVKSRTEVIGTKTIPWLLLAAKKPEGKGLFSSVKSIQRLNTMGGSAPATGCDRTQANTEIRVPYTAKYYFYVEDQSTP